MRCHRIGSRVYGVSVLMMGIRVHIGKVIVRMIPLRCRGRGPPVLQCSCARPLASI